jgi:hypothetical protein
LPAITGILSADTIDPMQGSVSQATFDLAVQAVAEKFGPHSVRRADPTIFRTLRISGYTMEVLAVAPQGMTDVYNLVLLEGRYPTGSTEIAASQEAFDLAGWQVGQSIEFYGQAFQVVGEVRYAAGKIASLWMTYAAGEQLFGSRRGFQIGAIQIAGDLDHNVTPTWKLCRHFTQLCRLPGAGSTRPLRPGHPGYFELHHCHGYPRPERNQFWHLQCHQPDLI